MKPFKFFHVNRRPRDYDHSGFEFTGVTSLYFSPETFEPIRYMLYRHIDTGEVIKGISITAEHPMWNYHDETV